MSLDLLNVLLINRSDIMKRSSLSGNVDTDKINPFILTAQDSQIQYLIGTKLYDKLRQLVKDGQLSAAGNEKYNELLEVYVTPTLVFYTLVDYLPFQAYEIANGGVYQHQSENSFAASRQDSNYLIEQYENKAKFYEERLLSYLCEKGSTFPEYYKNTGADMSPGSDGRKHRWSMSRNQDGIKTSRYG